MNIGHSDILLLGIGRNILHHCSLFNILNVDIYSMPFAFLRVSGWRQDFIFVYFLKHAFCSRDHLWWLLSRPIVGGLYLQSLLY